MKIRVTVIAVLTACLIASSSAFAGPANRPASRPAGDRAMGEHPMLKELNLTDQQKAAVREIMKAAHDKAKAAATKDQKVAIFKAAMEKIRAEVLTDEQRAKIDQAKEKIKQNIQERLAQMHKHMAKELNLTPEQCRQIKPVMEAAREQVKAASTPEAKAAIVKDAMAKVRALLTPEQQTKFDKMQAKWQERRQEMGQKIRQRMHDRMGKGGASKPAK